MCESVSVWLLPNTLSQLIVQPNTGQETYIADRHLNDCQDSSRFHAESLTNARARVPRDHFRGCRKLKPKGHGDDDDD